MIKFSVLLMSVMSLTSAASAHAEINWCVAGQGQIIQTVPGKSPKVIGRHGAGEFAVLSKHSKIGLSLDLSYYNGIGAYFDLKENGNAWDILSSQGIVIGTVSEGSIHIDFRKDPKLNLGWNLFITQTGKTFQTLMTWKEESSSRLFTATGNFIITEEGCGR
jgi:hypothetical protein